MVDHTMTDKGFAPHSGKPAQRSGITLRHVDQSNVLSSADGSNICALNDTALALWELCDGQTTPEEMAEAVCLLCSVNPAFATDDVSRTLEELTRAGVLVWADEEP